MESSSMPCPYALTINLPYEDGLNDLTCSLGLTCCLRHIVKQHQTVLPVRTTIAVNTSTHL